MRLVSSTLHVELKPDAPDRTVETPYHPAERQAVKFVSRPFCPLPGACVLCIHRDAAAAVDDIDHLHLTSARSGRPIKVRYTIHDTRYSHATFAWYSRV